MQSLLWRQEIVKKQNIHHTEISNDELLKRKLEAQA